ncbi:MAG TPA: undecaprenyl-diphosphatase [Rhodospirillaceae bacterium]|nr:MAG: undecaprenyl-diphosphatase [Alphaproteobacteria bacterium GWF2_58_20]HAU29531.1 undecaprenyl-diphosphatase [Rhodospirillaceae bacterium]
MTPLAFLHAAFLGVLEGLTEFLPVSSTGHLILAEKLSGIRMGESFDIVIQLGAILAICWVYREKLLHVMLTLFSERSSFRFAANIALAFLPAVVIGLLAHDFIKTRLFNPLVVATSLVLGGLAILVVERFKPAAEYEACEALPWWRAFLVGVFQCIAMIPGVSRSGATIMGALLLKVKRKTAAEFSFFLAIPTMLGASVLDLYKAREALTMDEAGLIAVGFLTAFVSALFVVRAVIGFIGRHGFAPFAWYRIGAGLLMLGVFWP